MKIWFCTCGSSQEEMANFLGNIDLSLLIEGKGHGHQDPENGRELCLLCSHIIAEGTVN